MKKLLLCTVIAGVVILANQAFAAPKALLKTQACPFQDNFSIEGPLSTGISSLHTDGNASAQVQDPVHFTVGCADNNNSENGNIYMTVAHGQGQCQLTINDGPYLMNPIVASVNCTGGLQYNGMNHPFGSYQYSLMFS